jgi:hypothetical protein
MGRVIRLLAAIWTGLERLINKSPRGRTAFSRKTGLCPEIRGFQDWGWVWCLLRDHPSASASFAAANDVRFNMIFLYRSPCVLGGDKHRELAGLYYDACFAGDVQPLSKE